MASHFQRRLPSVILSPLWVVLVSAEVGAWRLQEEGHHPPEHFDPLWKLFYMWEHPYHFPLAAWRAFSAWGDRLWQELMGIVGWQDILLPTWTYFALTVLSVSRAVPKTSGERHDPCTRGGNQRACCFKLCHPRVFDFLSHLYPT